jgi:hypothetical protein
LAGIVEIVPLFTNPDVVKDEVVMPDGSTKACCGNVQRVKS